MLIITISIFICVTLGVMGLYWLVFRPQSAATERLKRMGESGGTGIAPSPTTLTDDSRAGALAGRMAGPLQRLAPPSAAEARKLQRQLMHAGYRSENGPVVYRGLQLLSLVIFPAFVAMVCAILGRPLNSAVSWIVVAFAVGAYLPRVVLKRMIATEMPEPVATEFRKTYEEQNLGLSLKLALENLAERVPLLDLRLCVTAIMIQRETGGNLAEILEKVAYTIRERFRILEDLKTLTTSSRMSAWILCGLPVFVALAVTVMNPEYMGVLWRDPRGHNLLFAAAFMQFTGMLIIRKILKIKI